jgi:hypothetical protein
VHNADAGSVTGLMHRLAYATCCNARHLTQTPAQAVDDDVRTSEGLLIFSPSAKFTGSAQLRPGALVRARGSVVEYRPANSKSLRTTELIVGAVTDVAVCNGASESGEMPASLFARSCCKWLLPAYALDLLLDILSRAIVQTHIAGRTNRKASATSVCCLADNAGTVKPITVGGPSRERTPPADAVYKGPVDLETCKAACPALQPEQNGLDFWESLESTLIEIPARSLTLLQMLQLCPAHLHCKLGLQSCMVL